MASYRGAHFFHLIPLALGNSLSLPPFSPRCSASLPLSHTRRLHHHRALWVCPDDATAAAGAPLFRRPSLKLLGGAVSSLSSPIHENQRYNPRTIPIYAMEIFWLWILLSGSSVDGMEVGLMINLNRYGDSLFE